MNVKKSSGGGDNTGSGWSNSRRRLILKALLGLSASSVLYGSLDGSAWRAYEGVEEAWIRDRHELLVEEAPAAMDAAAIDLEVRLADLRKRAMEFRHLSTHDAALLHGGIWQLTSLPVSPHIQKDLLANVEYRRVLDKLKQLTDSLRKHPQYETLQRAQTRLWKTPQYREIHRRYTGKMQDLQRTYGSSPPPSLSVVDSQ